jgi:hypothetical protein
MAKKPVKKARTRARTAKGHYKKDDPATPNVNEAFVKEEVAEKQRVAQRSVGGRYLGGKLVE